MNTTCTKTEPARHIRTVLIEPKIADYEDLATGIWLPTGSTPLGACWDPTINNDQGGVCLTVWVPVVAEQQPCELHRLVLVPDYVITRYFAPPPTALGMTYVGAVAVPDAGVWSIFFSHARYCDGNLLACNSPTKWMLS